MPSAAWSMKTKTMELIKKMPASDL
uniref:Uncharacterized protein n=1 Tax=Rhizophora mucronata TaxID=61149 RepID=A0A2P2Q7X6_RHIMU